jgi:hypothetical protein
LKVWIIAVAVFWWFVGMLLLLLAVLKIVVYRGDREPKSDSAHFW